MPDINRIIQKHRKVNPGIIQKAIEIDHPTLKRPWEDLEEDRSDFKWQTGYEEKTARTQFRETPKESIVPPQSVPELWYATGMGVLQAIRFHQKALIATFAISLLIVGGLASFFPSSYYSTLHLYAPEKADSISSRLQMFSNRIEFASFPVDFKIPLRLIARRLASDEAQQWVVNAYKAEQAKSKNPEAPSVIDQMVRAETFYAEGSELLVIQGYANDPDIATRITNLYWDYLEQQIVLMRDENLKEIHRWIELTSMDWNQRMDEISQALAAIPSNDMNGVRDQLNGQLVTTLSNAQLQKKKIDLARDDLRRALRSSGTQELWALNLPEIQDLKRIDQALQQGAINSQSHDEIVKRANDVAEKKLKDFDTQSRIAGEEIGQIKLQMADNSLASKNQNQFNTKQSELTRQQEDYAGRIEELTKLSNQINVESTLAHGRLRPIRTAFPDPSTRRPLLAVKFGLCLLLSILATIAALLILQRKKVKMPSRAFA